MEWLSDEEAEALRRDYEDARRRRFGGLTLSFEDATLLRKGRKRQARRRLKAQAARLLVEAEEQIGETQPFEGDVSVDIAVLAGDDLHPPQAPDVVKAYLDLIEGLAYENDRQVAHLSVSRFALDHPGLVAGRERFGYSQEPDYLAVPRVLISIEPADWYSAAFDRARVRAEAAEHEWRSEDNLPPSPWGSHWGEDDYVEMEDLQRDVRVARRRGGRMNEQIAEFESEELARLRTRFLLDCPLGAADRPGPLPADVQRMLDTVPSATDTVFHRHWPGIFHLPVPQAYESSAAWRELVRASIRAEQESWRGFSPTVDARLALDLAVRGTDAAGHDLDNLAHEVLVAFEQVYCNGRRGSVVEYRAYRCEAPPDGGPDLRALITSSSRLRALDEHIEAADWAAIEAFEEHREELERH